MTPAANGSPPLMPHTRLTSTRAPRPHGTPQGQPAARSEALALPEALAKDTRANEHDAVKARGPMPPAANGTTPFTPDTRLTSTHALGPMASPKGNQQPDPKPLPLLKPLQKTPEQKNMMRSRHEGPMPPAAIGTTPPTHHTCQTSTRAPRPHGARQEQPEARPEALAPPEALAKDTRAKEHDAAKARGTHAPRGDWHHAPHAPHPPHLDLRTSAPWHSPRATSSPT